MSTEEHSNSDPAWDDLEPEQKQRLLELADGGSGVTRRDVLAGGGALGFGALLGGGASQAMTEPVAASHGDGTVGAAGSPIDTAYVTSIDGDGDTVDIGPALSTDDARTKTHPVVDVTHPDFGAVGDGATDDLAAIDAAISAADPGDRIYFPPGAYRVTATVQPTKDVIIDMGEPLNQSSNAEGDIRGAYLTQANGDEVGTLFDGNNQNIGGNVNVAGNKTNQTADVVGVRYYGTGSNELTVATANCTTGTLVTGTENSHLRVFSHGDTDAVECNDSVSDTHEIEIDIHAHDVDRYAFWGNGTTKAVVRVIAEQVAGNFIQVDFGTYTFVSPIVRGCDGIGLRKDGGGNVTTLGGSLNITSSGTYGIDNQSGDLTVFGTEIITSNISMQADGSSSVIEAYTPKCRGQATIGKADQGADLYIRGLQWPTFNASGDDFESQNNGRLTVEMRKRYATDADLSATGGSGRHLIVMEPVSTTERDNISTTGFHSVQVYNVSANRWETWDGSAWYYTNMTAV